MKNFFSFQDSHSQVQHRKSRRDNNEYEQRNTERVVYWEVNSGNISSCSGQHITFSLQTFFLIQYTHSQHQPQHRSRYDQDQRGMASRWDDEYKQDKTDREVFFGVNHCNISSVFYKTHATCFVVTYFSFSAFTLKVSCAKVEASERRTKGHHRR